MKKLLLLLLLFPAATFAQLWSSVLSSSRAMDWTNPGVVGGIPSASWTQCGATIAAAGATTTTVQNAITACGANQYVMLGAGTFTIGGLFLKSNMALRGSGADQTFIVFNGHVGCFSYFADICFSRDTDYAFSTAQGANWTAGYSQGATSITLTNVGSVGIVNGQYIMLGQANDTTPNNQYFVCTQNNVSPNCSLEALPVAQTIGGNVYSQWQTVRVTAGCATTCTGAGPFTLTITPGLIGTNWTSSKSPVAWWSWLGQGATQNVGLENLSMDGTSDGQGSNNGAITELYNCYNCWQTGTRSMWSTRAHVWVIQAAHATIQNNYFYGTLYAQSASYGIEQDFSSNNLVTNNVFQRVTTPIIFGNGLGNVVSYNFMVFPYQTAASSIMYSMLAVGHDGGTAYNLYEGNMTNEFAGDSFHGTSGLHTAFRNVITGWASSTWTNGFTAFQSTAYNRYWNLIGNVLGTPGKTTQYTSGSIYSGISIYVLGTAASNASSSVPFDSLATSTSMFWGNYSNIDPSNNPTTAAQFNASEVPSGISPYPNPVPSSHTLPASFYLSSAPSFWPSSKPFPPIGPEITGGNVGQCTSGTYNFVFALSAAQCGSGASFSSGVMGGRINSIPAMDCFLNVMGGPADGTGSALSFNVNNCYATPPPPVGITLNPTSLNFGTQLIGTTSSSLSFTVTNSSASAVTISSIVASGDFAQTNNCPASLASSASCTVNATFTPTAAGGRNGSVVITSSAVNSPTTESLNGTGASNCATSIGGAWTAPAGSFTAQTGNFSTQPFTLTPNGVGTTSIGLSQNTNASSTGLNSMFIEQGGDGFWQVYGKVGGSNVFTDIPNGQWSTGRADSFVWTVNVLAQTFSVTVTFPGLCANGCSSPTVGFSTAATSLGFYNLSPNSPNSNSGTLTVCGFGVATQPSATINPTSLTFPGQLLGTTSTSMSFTFTNNGPGSLTISSITITGDFTQNNNCPSGAGITPGQSCTFNVSFTPTVLGARSGSITIVSSASNSPSVESLAGTGITTTTIINGTIIYNGAIITQ